MSINAADMLTKMYPGQGGPGAASSTSAAGAFVKSAGGASGTFAQYMQRDVALPAGGGGTLSEDDAKRAQAAEKAAGDLISNALILPMLKQLRRSPWGENTVFSGGIGEKAFGPQFDIQISDRIAHSPRLGVKKALTERLIKRGQRHAASKTKSAPLPSAAAGATTQHAGGLDVHG